ncbi:endo-1,4-beta-xylanase [Sphaerisporangium dianthi]|uniref:Beta-xylanase n=1 Tax=Sphaerisporangium dianthi TaxID=1436120 RepID=A0ABV9CKU9_9ACTN
MRGRTVALITAAAMTAGLFAAGPAGAGTSLAALAAQGGRHFGAGVDVGQLNDVPYTTILNREFNAVTPTDAMKWDATEPNRNQFYFVRGDRIVAHARQQNMIVRGHALVWHSQAPAWVQSLNPAMLRDALNNHVTGVAAHYRGAVYAWNVVNEPLDAGGGYRNSFFYQRLGASYISDSFRAARAADPGAKLYLSEYGAEGVNAKSDGLYGLVRGLLADGVPIDGVAFQGHMVIGQVPPDVRQNLQRFADLGLDVAITELDVRMPLPRTAAQDAQQAADYATMTRACLAVVRCESLTLWTFSDKYSIIPWTFPGQGAATPWDATMRPKPAYTALYTTLASG